ncbi:MAG: glutamate--tRNA ligase family protein, partial [Pseudomonadota bacterium]
ELEAERAQQMKAGRPPRYEGKCKKLADPLNKPYALRFDVDKFKSEGNIHFHDVIKKIDITVSVDVIGDFVVMKRSGVPTYNFAVVVDDIDMKITHVFRGEDHISNTSRQLMVYMALGKDIKDIPVFGHLPMLLAPDKSKLSKRSGGIPIHEYKAEGYLPEAVFNHIALLGGGSFSEISETSSKEELVKAFDYTHTATSACVYDIEKLRSINLKVIHGKSSAEILQLLSHDMGYTDDWKNDYSDKEFLKTITMAKEGAHTLLDVIENLKLFLPQIFDENIYKKFTQEQKNILDYTNSNFSAEEWSSFKEKAATATGVSGGKLFKTLRLILTGKENGPPLDGFVTVISRDVVISRIKKIKSVLG